MKNNQVKEKYDLIVLMWNAIFEIAHIKYELTELFKKLKSLLAVGGKILINIDDLRNIDPAMTGHVLIKEENGKKYEMNWKVLNYNQETKLLESLESFSVVDLKTQKVLQTSKGSIYQTWWGLDDIQEEADEIGLSISVRSISLNEELYLVLR
ncbi:MAG: hypothetical protein Q9M91_05610 [Candidatus Dojkabacteria bacterium]|nr:hypothetical protein [Candidatus Dojkabacteria bacterium]